MKNLENETKHDGLHSLFTPMTRQEKRTWALKTIKSKWGIRNPPRWLVCALESPDWTPSHVIRIPMPKDINV